MREAWAAWLGVDSLVVIHLAGAGHWFTRCLGCPSPLSFRQLSGYAAVRWTMSALFFVNRRVCLIAADYKSAIRINCAAAGRDVRFLRLDSAGTAQYE